MFSALEGSGCVTAAAITAPGSAALPWACSRRHRHYGPSGCRVDRAAATEWNRSAPARWRRMHRTVQQKLKRSGVSVRLLVRVWEEQKRGVLHVHVVLGYSTPADRAAARLYVQELSDVAERYGFGFVDRKLKQWSAGSAAYLSSYFVRGRNRKASITETVLSENVPDRVFYVRPALMQASGVSMRSLRLKRRMWAVEMGLIHPPGFRRSFGRWVDPVTGEVWDSSAERAP